MPTAVAAVYNTIAISEQAAAAEKGIVNKIRDESDISCPMLFECLDMDVGSDMHVCRRTRAALEGEVRSAILEWILGIQMQPCMSAPVSTESSCLCWLVMEKD